MTAVNLKLTGMSCASCANNIERAILNVQGVIDGSVNFSSDRATVNYDPQQTNTNIISQAVAEVGDEAHGRIYFGHLVIMCWEFRSPLGFCTR